MEIEKKTYLLQRGYVRDEKQNIFYKKFIVKEKYLMFMYVKKVVNFIEVKFYTDGMIVRSICKNNVDKKKYQIQYKDGNWTLDQFKGIIQELEEIQF
jgi:hypothetical protein